MGTGGTQNSWMGRSRGRGFNSEADKDNNWRNRDSNNDTLSSFGRGSWGRGRGFNSSNNADSGFGSRDRDSSFGGGRGRGFGRDRDSDSSGGSRGGGRSFGQRSKQNGQGDSTIIRIDSSYIGRVIGKYYKFLLVFHVFHNSSHRI